MDQIGKDYIVYNKKNVISYYSTSWLVKNTPLIPKIPIINIFYSIDYDYNNLKKIL